MIASNLDFYGPYILNTNLFKQLPVAEIEKFKKLAKLTPFSSHNILEFSALHPSTLDFSVNIVDYNFRFNENFLQHTQQLILANWRNNQMLQKHIADAWLEFDSQKDFYSESIFFTIKNLNHRQPAIIHSFLKQLPTQLENSVLKQLEIFLTQLPEKAIISHIGIMSSRENSPLRINIKNLDSDFLPMVKKWFPQTPAIISTLIEHADKLTLTLDITANGVDTTRFGIECFFNEQHLNYPAQKNLLQTLVEHELCSKNTRDTALDWIDVLPSKKIVADQYLSSLMHSYVWRIINHIKIVVKQTEIQAKIYLSFGHQWKMK